jgi:hypothetical protein
MIITKKWLLISESRDDSNRCTPYRGKPDQHATHFPCSIRVWSWTIHLPWSAWATFRQSPRGWNMPLHKKKLLATKDRLSQPSSWVASFFLPCDSPRVGRRGFGPVITQLHQLTGVITPTCDRYVQYLLTGANPSVLSRHIRGLQPSRCRLSTYYSPTFPIDGFHFPPKGLVRSSV